MTRLLLILILVLMPSLAQATVIFQDDFEVPLTSSGWTTDSCQYMTGHLDTTGAVVGSGPWPEGCNPQRTTAQAHSGTYSLLADYTLLPLIPDGGAGTHGVWITNTFSPTTTDLYTRFYYRTSNFQYYAISSTKNYYMSGDNVGGYPIPFLAHWYGSREFSFTGQGIVSQVCPSGNAGQTCNFPPNMAAVPINDGEWYCIETHWKYNTPGSANGTIELWVNGVQTLGYYNQTFLSTDPTVQYGNALAYFSHIKIFTQAGAGLMYYDDFAVGDTRINDCGGASSDTTPPTAVTNLAVNNNTAGQPVLTWTNGTDNIGVTGQNILRCVGTGCTPVTIYAVLSGINTTYTDLQTVGGTVYGYQVNDFDAAGNQGTYSSVVSDTSGVATNRTTTFTDNFTRADNASLGVNYDTAYTGFFSPQIVSNAVEESSTANPSTATYTGVMGNDQFACITLSSFSSGDASAVVATLKLRFAAPFTVSGYYVQARAHSSATTLIRKVTNGTQTNLLTENSTAWSQGDQLCGEINGTTITAYRNNVAILSVSDATYASGQVGFELFNGTAFTNVVLDDFTVGTLGAPAPEPTIASAACNTTGCTLTYGTTTPTQIRVARGSSIGQYDSTIYPISSFPAGRYSVPGGAWVGGLTYVCFYAINASGVENDVSNAYICQSLVGVAPTTDTVPVTLSNGVPSSNLAAGTTSTIISATIDKNAVCRYDTTDPAGSDFTAYQSLANTMSTSSFTTSATVTGLTNGSTHTYYVRCDFQNSLGTNIPNPTSFTITVIVDNATPDTVAPSTVTGLTATALGQSQATLAWNAATAHGTKTISGYFAYSCFVANCSDAVQATANIITTTTVILNLTPATTYYFCVKAVDSANILSAACSNIPASITTGPVVDVIPPSDMANLRQIGVFQNSAVLTWDQGADNSGAVTTTIEMSPAGCTAFSVIVSRLTLTQLVVNLAPSTTYCFRGKFSDASGNISVNYSNVLQVTTNSAGLPRPRLNIPSSRSSTPRTGTGTRTPR